MAPKKKKVTKQKVKKKKWVSIIAPKSFKSIKLGETHVVDPQTIIGRSLKVNLMNITGSFKKQNIIVRFDINSVKDGKAYTFVSGFENSVSLMKRIVRKGRTKVEDSFLAKTKDGFSVRVKPVVLTLNRASKGAQTSIRKIVKEKLIHMLSGIDFDKAVQELIDYNFQKLIKEVSSTIHPVKSVEVRFLAITPASKKNTQIKVELPEADEVKSETPETSKTSETPKTSEVKPETEVKVKVETKVETKVEPEVEAEAEKETVVEEKAVVEEKVDADPVDSNESDEVKTEKKTA